MSKAVALQMKLEELFNSHNTSTTTTNTVIPATFMRILVNVPGAVR